MGIFEQLSGYLSFSFVRYALIAGVLIALCSSLLGVTLVLKRFSVIGDGLSHVAFGALAIATVLHLQNNMILVMPVTVLCAVLLLCANQNARIKGDAAIAMLSVSALALGYLIQKPVLPVRQCVGGRLQHAVRLVLHPDAFQAGCLDLRGHVRHRHGGIFPVLPQDFRRDVRRNLRQCNGHPCRCV